MLLMSRIFKLKGIFSGLFGLVWLILWLGRLESWEVEICLSINTRNFVNKLIILYSTGVCFVEKHGREIGTLSISFGYQIKWFWCDLYEKNFFLINRAPLVLWSKDVDRFFVMITNTTVVQDFFPWSMFCFVAFGSACVSPFFKEKEEISPWFIVFWRWAFNQITASAGETVLIFDKQESCAGCRFDQRFSNYVYKTFIHFFACIFYICLV